MFTVSYTSFSPLPSSTAQVELFYGSLILPRFAASVSSFRVRRCFFEGIFTHPLARSSGIAVFSGVVQIGVKGVPGHIQGGADPLHGPLDQKGPVAVQITDRLDFFLAGHAEARLADVRDGVVDDGFQYIADIVGKALVLLLADIQLGVQQVSHTEHIADVQVDAQGGHDSPALVPEISGGGFEGAAILGMGHVRAGVAVRGQLFQGLQSGVGPWTAHGTVGDMSVGDGDDGVVVILCQVVEDDLAGRAKLVCDAVTEQLDIFQIEIQGTSLPAS